MNSMLQDIVTESWSWPWWGMMVAVNIISVIIFILILFKTIKDNKKDPKNKKYRITLLVFGAIYVSVAMYRSIFVSSYTGRLAWFDSMANSMVVIRSLATLAEISFAFLIALPLMHLNKEVGLPEGVKKHKDLAKFLEFSPFIIIICLCLAQFFAWSGLIMQFVALFAIEETLWCLGFASILPLAIIHLHNAVRYHKGEHSFKLYKAFLYVLCIFTVGYVLFQICYQLPFGYYLQIAQDMASGTHYPLSLESFLFAANNYHPTRSFEEWGGIGFFIWHSGYFSICVWMVLLFASAPRLLNEKK